jgi:hypothetical protein
MTTLDLTVRASTYGKTPSDLTARVNEFTKRERMRRGLRAFLPFFGAGCGLLLVPPHVVWLLLWTSVGIVFGRKRYRQEREFVSLTGVCPGCGKPEPVDLPEVLPAIQRCKSCGSFLKLEFEPR